MSSLRNYGGSPLEKYCPECGRELKSDTYLAGYNTCTGKRIIHTVQFCPKYFSMKSLSHFTKSYDENGTEIIELY